MADKTDMTDNNAEGSFFVDKQCIDCDLCRQMAPDFFGRNDDGTSFIIKQPESEEEIAACTEAMESCPVAAIGNE